MTPVELIQQFIIATPNVIIGSDDGVIRMPFRCQYKDRAFYIHIRQISSAYFPNRPDVTRIQLAKNSAFDNITKDNCDLLYLGYDNDNDVYVCWDYRLLKERLNQAKNVSLYSLKSQQGKVQKKQIIQFKLENGDSPVAFKRTDFEYFIDNIGIYFPMRESITGAEGKVTKIVDKDLRKKLIGLLKVNHTLEALNVLGEYYGNDYPNMSLKDWKILLGSLNMDECESDVKEPIRVDTEPEQPTPTSELGKEASLVKNTVVGKFVGDTIRYWYEHDSLQYNQFVKALSYCENGVTVNHKKEACYIYRNNPIYIPRFIIVKEIIDSLDDSCRDKGRWIKDFDIVVQGKPCYISNQWQGHGVINTSNLRIDDFVKMIETISDGKYSVSFTTIDSKCLYTLHSTEDYDKETATSDIESSYHHFESVLRNLHCSSHNGQKAPHKAILLLSIIELIEAGLINNEIRIDSQLENKFKETWAKYISNDKTFHCAIVYPFFHMQNESFWNLVPRKSADAIKREYSSLKSLKEDILYAKIDDRLLELFREQVYRTKLRVLLVSEYCM